MCQANVTYRHIHLGSCKWTTHIQYSSYILTLLTLHTRHPTSAILYSPTGALYINISNRGINNGLDSLSLATAAPAAPATTALPPAGQSQSVALNSSGPTGPVILTGVRQWPDTDPWPFMVHPQSGGYQERPSRMEIMSQYSAGTERILAMCYWRYMKPFDPTPKPICVGLGASGWCKEDVQCPYCNRH